MTRNQSGFTPIQIILSILAGIFILGGIVGIVLIVLHFVFNYLAKPEIKEPDTQQQSQQNQQSTIGNQIQQQSLRQNSQQPGNLLNIFFIMHVEPGGSGEGEEKQLSENTFNRIKNATLKVADVLEKHGMKGNFEIVYRVSKDALTYEGQNNFIKQLEDRGHFIAVHSHHWMIMKNKNECERLCGNECVSDKSSNKNSCFVGEGGIDDGLETLKKIISDISAMAFRSSVKIYRESGGLEFSRAAELGAKIVNDNYNPTDAVSGWSKNCSDFGYGDNNWYKETGNLLHPWRPDYSSGNLCNNNPNGKIVYIDQVTGDWLRAASGNGQSSGTEVASGSSHKTLNKESFDVLRKYSKGALNHLSSEQLNVWGWPQHEIEYLSQNEKGVFSGEYNQGALDALNDFLAELDEYKNQGKIKYVTLEDIYNEYTQWEKGDSAVLKTQPQNFQRNGAQQPAGGQQPSVGTGGTTMGKCGDGVCGPIEKANPNVCPADCK